MSPTPIGLFFAFSHRAIINLSIRKGGVIIAKSKSSCKPSSPVRKAGKTLATSSSKSAKSKASKTLNNHKSTKH